MDEKWWKYRTRLTQEARQVRIARRRVGIQQQVLATAAGKSKVWLAKRECGHVRMKAHEAEKLLAIIKVTQLSWKRQKQQGKEHKKEHKKELFEGIVQTSVAVKSFQIREVRIRTAHEAESLPQVHKSANPL